MSLNFPDINPVAISIGPINIYWYALSYVAGTLFAGYYTKKLAKKFSIPITDSQIDNFLTYGIIGMIIGGRLGYVLFYEPTRFFNEPLEIFRTYNGGMSFHGGIAGVILATIYYCYKNKINFFYIADLFCVATPIGFFLGRIANFINGELYGKPTNVAWSFIFPYTDGNPRHPSQLYEAALEGLLLFAILNYATFKYGSLHRKGLTSGLFLFFYGIFRIIVENFREPDAQLGYFWHNHFSMGQILTLPMLLCGMYLIYASNHKNVLYATSIK